MLHQPGSPVIWVERAWPQDTNSFTKGRELFRDGLLTEAMLAFEAEAQRNPSNVEAWRMLGTVQAENDDDLQVGAMPQHSAFQLSNAKPGNFHCHLLWWAALGTPEALLKMLVVALI